jgi:hypothetical protein
MRINVVSVESNKVPGKAWKQLDVSYKNENGELKGRKIMSFSVKNGLDILTSAKEGDLLDVEVVQKDGYWNWVGVAPASGPSKSNGKSSGYSVPSRDFETKTERAARQVLIVRQSCLSTATAVYAIGKTVPTHKEIIELASKFEEFVFASADAPHGAEAASDNVPF